MSTEVLAGRFGRPPLTGATFVAATLVAVLAGCTSGVAGPASPGAASPTRQPPTAPAAQATGTPPAAPVTTPAAASIAVASTLEAGPLEQPTPWIATVTGATASDPVDHVDFLIDGTVTWTEHNVPYQFNDDGNLLMPSVLAPGAHQMSAEAVTSSGATASVQVAVTTSRPDVPASLLGAWIRKMPGGGGTPAGDWRLTFADDGVITIDDPGGSGANEGFQASGDGWLTLYGPANWVEPEDRRGSFCDQDPEGVARLHWAIKGKDLVLSAVDPDPCTGRSFLFDGAWHRG